MNTLDKLSTSGLSGLKKTASRIAVLDILQKEDAPVDINHIIGHLKSLEKRIDQATIYRIIDAFYKKGIIDRLEFGEGKFRYEIKGEDHHHLICENCGRVEEVKDNVMQKWEKEIQKLRHFTIRRHNLEFFGLCPNCQI